MTSTNGSTATGLKKWMPTTRSGWSRSVAISVTDSEEVLVASTHWAGTIRSNSASTCFLMGISSKTASMTRSASVFEEMPIKKQVLAELERILDDQIRVGKHTAVRAAADQSGEPIGLIAGQPAFARLPCDLGMHAG